MLLIVFKLMTCVVLCIGQQETTQNVSPPSYPIWSEVIGNFSLELLVHSATSQSDNIIMSPFNIFSALAATAEGAVGKTRRELQAALRIGHQNRTLVRTAFQEIADQFTLNTTTINLYWFNGIFCHDTIVREKYYQNISRLYDAFSFQLDFRNSAGVARLVNSAVCAATRNRMNKLVNENDFNELEVLVASAAYFGGNWTTAFNVASTLKQPFYDINGVQIGEVNMMYNRYPYRFVDIPRLRGKVIELPYGAEKQMSMLVLLPYPGISLMTVMRQFLEVPLNHIFAKLESFEEEHGRVQVDCFIPRFSIESNLELKDILRNLGINRLFDYRANLGRIFRTPVYVGKVIHKSLIEVSEEGINATATDSEFVDATDVLRFEANRPFLYFVIGNKMKTILYLGLYQRPYLY